MAAVASSPARKGAIVERVIPSSPSSTASYTKRKLDLIQPEPAADSWRSSKRERVLSSATRICIIPDKLTEEQIDHLRDRIIDLGGMNSSLAYANVILTTLRAEKRILRQLDQDVIVRKCFDNSK
jgi:hypothetical protein